MCPHKVGKLAETAVRFIEALGQRWITTVAVMNQICCTLLLMISLTVPYFSQLQAARAQAVAQEQDVPYASARKTLEPCVDPSTHPALMDALRLLCSRRSLPLQHCGIPKAIVIGFVGGFVRPDDVRHPEVLFASYLQRRYGSTIFTGVFGNHESTRAANRITTLLDSDRNGSLTPVEKKSMKIILYGHSWGASQTLALARELQQQSISVALTIQIDSVRKWGQDDRTVPANVEKAVNFYQRGGLTPGQALIVAADPGRTTILGNFHMTYHHHQIRCDNYRWLSRVLNKPHHKIENDPEIWSQIASLIDSELSRTQGTDECLRPSESLR